MKKIRNFSSLVVLVLVLFAGVSAGAQQLGQDPALAFDPLNNRYLMVWSESVGEGRTQVMGKFLNADGSDGGSPVLLSPDRPTHGCTFPTFGEVMTGLSTPTNCTGNLSPTVAYNDGRYLIVWEVHGSSLFPGTSPESQFINIFARLVNADDLSPLSGWEEGSLISKLAIASYDSEQCPNGQYACSDVEIMAWGQSRRPHVTARVGTDGFMVTWENNFDYISCLSKQRRGGWSIYGRYIDTTFDTGSIQSASNTSTNPDMFAIYKDPSTMDAAKCEVLANVNNGYRPRVAFNQNTNDFVVTYELARANHAGTTVIGAKQVILGADNVGQVDGNVMPSVVASVDGTSLVNPEVISYEDSYVLLASDGSNVRGKVFSSGDITASTPDAVDLGSGNQTNPRAASNLGLGGQGPVLGGAPTRIGLTYQQDGDLLAVLLDGSLAVVGQVLNLSTGQAVENQLAEVATNREDLVVVWQGDMEGDRVFSAFLDTGDVMGDPPTTPDLVTPDDNVTFAPTRAYLSWNASTDPDGGEVTYNVYFGEDTIPAVPQATGIMGTSFVIGPETQSLTGITLEANKTYLWKIEAVDDENSATSSEERTLNTDNSVVGWWRFDEDPNGTTCPGGSAGETVCDYSGNNNHGTPNNSPTWIMPGMRDILLGAIELDGVDQWIEVPDFSTNGQGSISIATSLRLDANPPGGNFFSIISKLNVAYLGIRESGGTSRIVWNIGDGTDWYLGGNPLSSTTALTVGTIYRVVTTYDGIEGIIHLNGTADAMSNFGGGGNLGTTGIISSIGALWFGTLPNDVSQFYDGMIDEMIVYNKNLPTPEVVNDNQSI